MMQPLTYQFYAPRTVKNLSDFQSLKPLSILFLLPDMPYPPSFDSCKHTYVLFPLEEVFRPETMPFFYSLFLLSPVSSPEGLQQMLIE